jgi:hypothetical protein
MADDDDVGRASALADLIGDHADVHQRLAAYVRFGRPLGEFGEHRAPALLEDLAHLRGEIEIRLEAERAGDVVEEGPLDRDDVDHVLRDACVKSLGD